MESLGIIVTYVSQLRFCKGCQFILELPICFLNFGRSIGFEGWLSVFVRPLDGGLRLVHDSLELLADILLELTI